MVIVEVGAEHTGQWVTETRNVYEDYRRAFGEEPGRVIAVAILTDTDATRQKVTAYYGDIAFLAVEPVQAERDEASSASGTAPAPVARSGGLDCPAPAR
jgi:hypothetical protein